MRLGHLRQGDEAVFIEAALPGSSGLPEAIVWACSFAVTRPLPLAGLISGDLMTSDPRVGSLGQQTIRYT